MHYMIGLKNHYHNLNIGNLSLDQKNRLLSKSLDDLFCSLKPLEIIKKIFIGCELECYVEYCDGSKAVNQDIENFINIANNNDIVRNIAIISKEKGLNQIEFSTKKYDDLFNLSNDIDQLKNKLKEIAISKNLILNYTPQPYFDDCGSSLQFNISFFDYDNNNFFYNNSNFLDLFASTLLDHTNQMLFLLAPFYNSYLRFDSKINSMIFSKGKYPAPINLSYGYENRTCAIRIPSIKKYNCDERIEYRVACSDADHRLSIMAILWSLANYQFQKKIYKYTYGNAFDEIYNYEKIIDNYQLSKDIFYKKNNYINDKIISYLKN